jgi:hypothetical protein
MSILSKVRTLVSRPTDARHPIVPALVFGGVVTLAALAIYLVLLGEWPWQWSITRLLTVLNSLDAQGQWAFGQLYTGFVGVFLAGTLGYFAIQEFASSQEVPRLELKFWFPSGDLKEAIVVYVHRRTGEDARFVVAIHNVGTVIARWYTVQLTIPF